LILTCPLRSFRSFLLLLFDVTLALDKGTVPFSSNENWDSPPPIDLPTFSDNNIPHHGRPMRESPPPQLTALLERLGLANEAQLMRLGKRVRRLAGDLPRFESVWVDALVQARILTSFQAAEINAGRGAGLRIGPFILYEQLAWPLFAVSYRAKRIDSGEMVHLTFSPLPTNLRSVPGEEPGANIPPLPSGEGQGVRAKKTENIAVMSPLLTGEGPGVRAEKTENFKSISPPEQAALTLALSQGERGPNLTALTLTLSGHRPKVGRERGLNSDIFSQRERELLVSLEALSAASNNCRCDNVSPILEVGSDGNRLFAAAHWVAGQSAGEWMVHHGRFPPEVVLEIARSTAAGLVALEHAGVCHGDISANALMLTGKGQVVLLLPGVRAIFRPHEGYSHADLPPEAFDYLAPQRVVEGAPPDTASDLYAFGCLVWHLLCGRPPLGGGDGLLKLRAVQEAIISDVHEYALEVPGPLEKVLSSCLQREPAKRLGSMAQLAELLGPPTRKGQLILARCLKYSSRPMARWPVTIPSRAWFQKPLWLAGITVCLLAAASILWAVRNAKHQNEERPLGVNAENKGDSPIFPAGKLAKPPSSQKSGQSSSSKITDPNDLQLASDKPIDASTLVLHDKQRVHGAGSQRAVVVMPFDGWTISADHVCIEDIDFVWGHESFSGQMEKSGFPGAIINLQASSAEFHRCSFQSARAAMPFPIAIIWSHPAKDSDQTLLLPSGRVQLADCVLGRVGIGVYCQTIGAVALELTNTLFLGTDSLFHLDHFPKPDEPMRVTLSRVTLRDAGPLIECNVQGADAAAGEIAIQSADCVFAPAAGLPLMRFYGWNSPRRMLGNIRWTGQGSLISPMTDIAVWRPSGKDPQVMDESDASISGLVRSEMGFAGRKPAGPAANAIIRWQAPLQSADPPGIDPRMLPGDNKKPVLPEVPINDR
jgi:eukaryotic-like serine/threonine-protein kinase